MTQHPTKEQVDAAKAWAEGGGTTTDLRILDKEKPAATNAFYWRDKQSLLILAAALASAEREIMSLHKDAVVGRRVLEAAHFRRVYMVRRSSISEANWEQAEREAEKAIDAAIAAQRKEGE